MGFQEAGHESINRYLKAIIPSHGYVFVDELENKNSMAYRPELLKVVKKGLIWLTDTPSVPSLSTSGYVRTARWVIFEIVATGTIDALGNGELDSGGKTYEISKEYIVSPNYLGSMADLHLDPFGRVAFIVGSERYGITKPWYEGEYNMLSIPMLGQCDSLNVAIATTP